MKTRLIGAVVVALALLSPAPGHAENEVKYGQCTNIFRKKDGIQTGTIVKMASGEIYETYESAFTYETDLMSPLCTILKIRNRNYLLISGVRDKIMVRRLK